MGYSLGSQHPQESEFDWQFQCAIAKLQGVRLLLVEDNVISQELTHALLTNYGIHVQIANNGKEALELLQPKTFDGVLMDVHMPVMNGYTATQLIRQQGCYRDLPIIAMTANAKRSELDKALAVGMNTHIAKPICVRDLFQTLARWFKLRKKLSTSEPVKIGGQRKSPMAEVNVTQTALNTPTPPFLPMEGIDQVKGIENTENVALYHKLLSKFRDRCTNFDAEFCAEQHSNDPKAAMRYAHTLKSSAATLGIASVESAAFDLELAYQKRLPDEMIQLQVEAVQTALKPIFRALQVIQLADVSL